MAREGRFPHPATSADLVIAEAGYHARARSLENHAESTLDEPLFDMESDVASTDKLRERYDEALRRLARAEEVSSRSDDARQLAQIDLDRAEIHLYLHQPEEARSFARDAEQRFASLGLEDERGQAAHLAGRASELDDPHEADACFRRAEAIFADAGLAERRIGCMIHRARLAERRGRLNEARRITEAAAGLLERGMDLLTLLTLDLGRARIDLAEGRLQAARLRAALVVESCRPIQAPWVGIEALRIEGRSHALGGDIPNAILSYRDAIEVLEGHRDGLPPEEYTPAYLAVRSELYEEIVGLFIEVGDPKLAYNFSVSRAHAHELVG
ncbi:MAG: hypothetical protein ACYTDY_14175 [Planctomycetota bacterium]